MQRADRCGVVDDAFEGLRQPDQPSQPGERHRLELRRGRRRAPEHRLLVERRRQELGEHPGRAARDREVGEEPRVVPVGQSGHQDSLEVGHHRVDGPDPPVRDRQRGEISPGLTRASTGRFDAIEIVGDPIDQRVAVPAKGVGVRSGVDRVRSTSADSRRTAARAARGVEAVAATAAIRIRFLGSGPGPRRCRTCSDRRLVRERVTSSIGGYPLCDPRSRSRTS